MLNVSMCHKMKFVQDMEDPCSSNFITEGDFEYWTFLEILEDR